MSPEKRDEDSVAAQPAVGSRAPVLNDAAPVAEAVSRGDEDIEMEHSSAGMHRPVRPQASGVDRGRAARLAESTKRKRDDSTQSAGGGPAAKIQRTSGGTLALVSSTQWC